jgi:hypothetical protein
MRPNGVSDFVSKLKMEITPALGIGDILWWKIFSKQESIPISKININHNLIKTYRNKPEQAYKFIKYFLNKLFPEATIQEHENINTIEYPKLTHIDNPYLCDDYIFYKKYEIPYSNYIIFHTKARFDYAYHIFNNNKACIADFMSKYKTSKTIILLGEKYIDDCIEKNIHNIESVYDILLNLKNNNTVIDLTKDYLYNGNVSIEDFERDLQLINSADANITFGFGGNFGLCAMASKNTIGYIATLNHNILSLLSKCNNFKLQNTVDTFFEEISKN